MNEWNDISTVPKGVAVDLYGYFGKRKKEGDRLTDCWLSEEGDWWQEDVPLCMGYSKPFTPTHWMIVKRPQANDSITLQQTS